MLNQVILVGDLLEKNKNKFYLKVQRPYKNANGEYDEEIIEISSTVWLQENEVFKDIETGTKVGVKGHIETKNKIVAEKVTFLSSEKKDEIK